jgi:hypothetical protein
MQIKQLKKATFKMTDCKLMCCKLTSWKKNPKERLGADGSMDTITKNSIFTGLDRVNLKQKRIEPSKKPVKIPG